MAYSDIKDPSAYFQTKLYTGTNANQSITNDGNSDLKPDLIFASYRTTPPYTNHRAIIDSSRGRAKILESDTTAAEATTTNAAYDLVSFDTDGFTVGAVNSTSALNASGISHVAWQWKANGGTTASNSDGSVTSTVQANTDAGFSIVTFDSASSGNFSVGHGLGQIPAMIITKNREGTGQWYTWHQHLTGGTSNTSYLISLNRTDAEASYANAWGAGVTSSVFGMQSGNTATASNDYVAWCFAEKQGYSKFGKYVGNGNTNGAFAYTGFKPAFVMVKAISTAGKNWDISTGAVSSNQIDERLRANLNDAEESSGHIDFLSNGFKMRNTNGTQNSSGVTYIYMAFAENPFVANGIPTTAR